VLLLKTATATIVALPLRTSCEEDGYIPFHFKALPSGGAFFMSNY